MATAPGCISALRRASTSHGFSAPRSPARTSARKSGSGAGRAYRWQRPERRRARMTSRQGAGTDPRAGREAAKREAEKIPTFKAAARAVYDLRRPTWRNEKHAKQFLSSLETYAFPAIGDLPVDRIESGDVLRLLTPIWTEKAETARRVRQRIRTVLKWARACGHVKHNPAGDAIDGVLPQMPKVKNHHRALPYRDVAAALDRIDATAAWLATRLAMRFLALTAVRPGEVRGATWDEVDLDSSIWVIPKARMKAYRDHKVPLSDAALDVLRRARDLSAGAGLVFPSPRGRQVERWHVAETVARERDRLRSSRLPVQLPGLVCRNRETARRGRACAGAHDQGRRGRLFPVGPVRCPPPPDGRLGAVPLRRGRRESGSAS